MKRYFRIALAASLVLAFCACTKEEPVELVEENQAVEEGVDFQFTASFTETKTSIDEWFKMHWTEGDAVNVFHAEAGTNNFVNDGKFVYEERIVDGLFCGKLPEKLDPAKTYDWYVLYPYSEDVESPAKASFKYDRDCPTPGNGELNKLENLPLWSSIKGVDGSFLHFTMHHVYAVAKVTLNNVDLHDVTLTNFSISAASEYMPYTLDYSITMTGDVDFDITGEQVAVKKTENGYNPTHATVNYLEAWGEQLCVGKSWTVYYPVIPQTIPVGTYLTFTPNQGVMRKTVQLKAPVVFESGKIASFNVALENKPYITEAEMANPVLFRFCMPTDQMNISNWQDKTKAPKFFSTLDHQNIVYDLNVNKQTICAKAYLSILETQSDKPKIADSQGRWYLATGKIQKDQSLTVNAKFAKFPAGKKAVFHTSIFIAKPGGGKNYLVSYSLDGGATFKPATITADEAVAESLAPDQIKVKYPAEDLYRCFPVVISTDAAEADIENASLVIKITLNANNTDNTHIGFAPYYTYNAAEGLRSYRSKKEGTDATTHDGPYAWKWITTAEKASVPGDPEDITGCAYLTIE